MVRGCGYVTCRNSWDSLGWPSSWFSVRFVFDKVLPSVPRVLTAGEYMSYFTCAVTGGFLLGERYTGFRHPKVEQEFLHLAKQTLRAANVARDLKHGSICLGHGIPAKG